MIQKLANHANHLYLFKFYLTIQLFSDLKNINF